MSALLVIGYIAVLIGILGYLEGWWRSEKRSIVLYCRAVNRDLRRYCTTTAAQLAEYLADNGAQE